MHSCISRRGRCRSQPFATKERYGCGSAACRYTSARQSALFLRKSSTNPQLPSGPTESSAPTTAPALPCRGGRLCPPAEYIDFTEISGKFATSQRADVGIGPYNWRAANFAARRNARTSRRAAAYTTCILAIQEGHFMAVTRYFLGGNTASGFDSFYGQF